VTAIYFTTYYGRIRPEYGRKLALSHDLMLGLNIFLPRPNLALYCQSFDIFQWSEFSLTLFKISVAEGTYYGRITNLILRY
jgi:hypothetical protein